MNMIFKELMNEGLVYVYLDDIIIPSSDWADMLVTVKRVFEELRAARLRLKPAKCIIGAGKLDFLGFTVFRGMIQPGQKVLPAALRRTRGAPFPGSHGILPTFYC